MPERSVKGRSLISRRAIVEIVRAAVLGSYGVTGFVDDGLIGWLRTSLRLVEPGIRVTTSGRFVVDLRLTIAHGLPVAEVARQVDSAVRYAIRRALDRELDGLTIHVGGLRYQPASPPPPVEPVPGGTSRPQVAELLASPDDAADLRPGGDATEGGR